PDETVRWVLRLARLAPKSEYSANSVELRATTSTDQDHRRCAVSGDVCTARVDNFSEIDGDLPLLAAEHLLDQLLAELSLHEGVGGDLTDVTSRLGLLSADREPEEQLHEWHRQRVLAGARLVALSVALV